jgi:hypothetical protein
MELTSLIPSFVADVKGIHEMHSWMFDNLRIYIRGRTLLIGPGLESFASLILEHSISIHMGAENKVLVENLRSRYVGNALVRAIHEIDLSSANFSKENTLFSQAFNTLILLNSLKNEQIIQNVDFLLAPRGKLLITIPSFTASFQGSNLTVEEMKILDQKPLKTFLTGWEVQKTRHSRLEPGGNYITAVAYRIQ